MKILQFPNPHLFKVCEEVSNFSDALAQIADDMKKVMESAGGIGLSANQVGLLHRMFVMKRSDDSLKTFINPEILEMEGQAAIREGCLSLPGVYGNARRAEKIKVRYQNLMGTEFSEEFSGIEAVCIQHECEHLDGLSFIERFNRDQRRSLKKYLRKS